MRLKKAILLLAVLGVVSSARAQFVTMNINTCYVDRISGAYDSFKWKWAGYNTQSNKLFLFNGSTNVPFVLDGYVCGFKMTKQTDSGQVAYISVTNVTVSSNTLSWSVANTNIAPTDTYDAELFAWLGTLTNSSRTVAQGKITTFKSLYDEDDSTFPWPAAPSQIMQIVAGTNITISPASGVGTVTINSTASGGGGGDVTSVAGRAGAVVIVSGDLADFDTSVGTNADVVASAAKNTYPPADSNKLALIAAGATSNSPNATLLARANHTGTQLGSTISDLETLISNNTAVALNTGKTNYSDSGNVLLLDSTNTITADQYMTNDAIVYGARLSAPRIVQPNFGGLNGYNIANGVAATDVAAYGQIVSATTGLAEASATISINGDSGTLATNNSWTVGDFLADGTVKATGDFGMGGFGMTNLLDPVNAQDAVTKSYMDSATFTPYFIPYALTATVDRANGWMQSYLPTTLTTIVFEDGGTGGVDQVNLSLWAGTNSVTFGTNNVTFDTAVTPETNSTTTVLYYSPMWLTTWEATEL